MKFPLKNITSGHRHIVLGVIFITLTLIPIFVLSNLITQLTEKSNSESTLRSFNKKQEIITKEFSHFLETENEVLHIIQISSPKDLSANLKIFSTIQSNDSLVKNRWFQINNGKLTFFNSNTPPIYAVVNKFIIENGNKNHLSLIVQEDKNFYWRIYFKLTAKNGTIIRYGYDIDLKSLQQYFLTVDEDTPSYAFIFDKKGTVVYHPEEKFLRKNIFRVSNLTASDTVFNLEEKFNKRIAFSEFLNLDIVRYTQKLNLKGTDWYICVNFPKNISNENVDAIKKYASLIYTITTVILILLFFLFTRFNKKNFLEKEELSQEKNKLSLENEKINKEKALIQLQQLKQQINPHFLFNSLNSLYMLIDSDSNLARKFTLNLSRIYRYLINPPAENIVTLKEELLFIERYIFLQQTRFKDALIFTITIEDETVLSKKVPYLSFQIAIENAIKHNFASTENPLNTQIIIKKNEVVISNNLQEKQKTSNSEKFGHKYLESIYNFYSKSNFKTYKKDGYFICILPIMG